jgi:hypothetical protein
MAFLGKGKTMALIFFTSRFLAKGELMMEGVLLLLFVISCLEFWNGDWIRLMLASSTC